MMAKEFEKRNEAETKKGFLNVVFLCKWIQSVQCFLYFSQFLSAWRGRMWLFAASMFLIQISPDSLQLTATYGLVMGAATLVFAPLIGEWVDRNPRLRAARVPLLIQTWGVIGCSVLVGLFVTFREWIESIWNGWLVTLWQTVFILVAVLTNLARLGNRISVQRDWIVEICGREKDQLATLGATLRRIDLVTKIIAPIATGQVMTYTSLVIGAVFIAVWNFVSWFAEHFLLGKVYQHTPVLKTKHFRNITSGIGDSQTGVPMELMKRDVKQNEEEVVYTINGKDIKDDQFEATDKNSNTHSSNQRENQGEFLRGNESSLCRKMFSPCIIFASGWKTYSRTPVILPGMAMAALYLTVLGFDNITSGYAYSQGLSESLLGILMGCGAAIGIVGTFVFPRIRHRVGLVGTGRFSFSAQILCLVLCVVSIWVPGSPFDPYGDKKAASTAVCINTTNMAFDSIVLESHPTLNQSRTVFLNSGATNHSTDHLCPEQTPKVYVSVGMLLAGIITARFGLWISDLTITQLFLENVDETERGVVNGVQTSLNQMMDMLKFALVVAVPQLHNFGFLIITSFIAVSTGGIFYNCYARKALGHWCGSGSKFKSFDLTA